METLASDQSKVDFSINQDKQPGRFLNSLKNRIMIGLSKIRKTFGCGFTSLVLIPPALNQEKMVDSK